MGGGDHCYFFNAVGTVDVLTERYNNVNFVETQIRFERIYTKSTAISRIPPECHVTLLLSHQS